MPLPVGEANSSAGVIGGLLMSLKFDIFRRLPNGQPLWVKAVSELDEAKEQITVLLQTDPGDYFIFNALSGSVIDFGPNWTLAEK